MIWSEGQEISLKDIANRCFAIENENFIDRNIYW